MIYINGRFLTQRQTGTQRNAYELTIKLFEFYKDIIILMPNAPVNESYDVKNLPIKKIGFNKSALWEQLDLPYFLISKKHAFLVNLTNTAPVFYSNQLVSIMDMTVFIDSTWFNRRFATYYRWLVPKIVKKSKIVVTISECSKRNILKFTHVEESKVKVINCAVPSKFRSLANDEYMDYKDLLFKYSIREKQFFLAVSSLDPRKNFVNLIKGYQQLSTSVPLLIVGSKGKSFNDENLNNYEHNQNIIFTGYISDEELVKLYKSALCFVYPSLYEGFGIPPLEAMLCGCPTIVSNTSSMPEVCGDASIYVDPMDINSITKAMNDVIGDDNLRKNLIEQGYKRVNKFDWSYSAQQLIKEIEIAIN